MTRLPWCNDKTVHGFISRYYKRIFQTIPPQTIPLSNEILCLLEGQSRDDVLVGRHSAESANWILKRLETSNRPIRIYSSIVENNLFFRGLPFEQYSVFEWQHRLPEAPLSAEFEVRRLKTEDQRALATLFSGWAEMKMLSPGAFDYEGFIRDAAFGVFNSKEELVAVIGLFDQTDNEVEVGRAFTAPAFRGRNLQLALLKAQLEYLLSVEKVRRIVSLVDANNPAAERVFIKSHFAVVDHLCVFDLQAESVPVRR